MLNSRLDTSPILAWQL